MLIETKLHPPPARKEWVDRPGLVRYLDDAEARLILVDAPPGFGKTTLIAQWRCSTIERRPFAWVSLDRGDDDPTILWSHVVWALHRACPKLDSKKVLQALAGQAPDFAGTVVPMLVNELAAIPEPVVLVLDDYHLIKEGSCHAQIASLLGRLPASAQVVIITRADPPLPLGRMRATGEMVELRARELRFAASEAAALVSAVAAVELGDPDLADLVERTEGWPAGVYLAALCLRGHSSPSAFIRQFTGDNRFVVDFLADDVLSMQPGEVRQFLARTSILDRFCVPLCEAVTGSADAAKIIDVIERENLFLVPLDDSRQWFRYHHLFAQVLRGQLTTTEPDIVPALHERASAWYRASGSADEAITHALAAGDAAGAIALIARYHLTCADSGRMATVGRWLRSLGDDAVAATPLAAHCAMWLAALSGERNSVQRWLPVVQAAGKDGPLPDGMQSLESSAALLEASFGFDGIGPMREAGVRAIALETDPASPWCALAHSSFGIALYFSGEFELAAAQLQDARLSSTAFALVRLQSCAAMAWLEIEAGRLARAADLAGAAMAIATDPAIGLVGAPQSSQAYIASGAVHAAHDRLREARSDLEHALQIRRKWPGISSWPTLEVLLRLAPVLGGLGDRAKAAALVEEARQLLNSMPKGADAQLARLARIERRLAGRPQPALPGEPLTDREQEVLRLLQGTLSLRGIGRELYLSPNTIKTHTRALYRKLGVSDRQEAIAKARELGLL
jgi:LuxR family transcriptional regulator, maltose regulon positive regulatory protein